MFAKKKLKARDFSAAANEIQTDTPKICGPLYLKLLPFPLASRTSVSVIWRPNVKTNSLCQRPEPLQPQRKAKAMLIKADHFKSACVVCGDPPPKKDNSPQRKERKKKLKPIRLMDGCICSICECAQLSGQHTFVSCLLFQFPADASQCQTRAMQLPPFF